MKFEYETGQLTKDDVIYCMQILSDWNLKCLGADLKQLNEYKKLEATFI